MLEWSAEGLAEATLANYRKYDWDFIKVNPRATYYAEDWGSKFRASGRADQGPELIEPAVKRPGDLRQIEPLDVSSGAYGDQLSALGMICKELKEQVPVVQTVFSPLAVMTRLTGSSENVQQLMRENPDQLLTALNAVAATLSDYSRRCLQAGASGIFFATVEWGSADSISREDYDRFARPFDSQVLKAAGDAVFNVLHVCRSNNHLLALLDYPVAAFHWSSNDSSNPSLGDVASRTSQAVMGGVSQDTILLKGSPEDVAAEVRGAIQEMAMGGFLLAPGCSISPQTPEANIHALVETARS